MVYRNKLILKMHIPIIANFRSPYPSSDFNCVSDYLRASRPDLEDIRYVFVQSSYDAYAERTSNNKFMTTGFIRPDIVAILNCGFIFYSSWDKSIPYLLKYPEVPLIFTEYYEEDSKQNLQKVDALGKFLFAHNKYL